MCYTSWIYFYLCFWCIGSCRSPVSKSWKAPTTETPQRYKKEITLLYNKNIMTGNPIRLDEGTIATFECHVNDTKSYIEWTHRKGDKETISLLYEKKVNSFGIELNINKFDNDTELTCYAKSNNDGKEIANQSLHITVTPINKGNESDTKLHHKITQIESTSYNNNNESTCNNKELSNIKWLLIQRDKIVGIYDTKIINKSKLNETWFVCIGYHIERNKDHIIMSRIVEKYIHMRNNTTNTDFLQTTQSPLQIGSEKIYSQKSNFQTKLTIAGLVSGCVTLIVLIFICCYCTCRKNRITPQEAETYTSPRVQYVDLDIITSSSPRRNFALEESPYAQIIGFIEPQNK